MRVNWDLECLVRLLKFCMICKDNYFIGIFDSRRGELIKFYGKIK